VNSINRFSSRCQRLDHAFLRDRLRRATSYRRIAGYFRSSIFELVGEDVLQHLALNCPTYYDQRERVVEIAGYLAGTLETLRPAEASAARVLRDLVRNQRL